MDDLDRETEEEGEENCAYETWFFVTDKWKLKTEWNCHDDIKNNLANEIATAQSDVNEGLEIHWNALTVTPVKSDGFFIDKSWGLDYNLSRFTQFPARSSRHSRPDQSAIFNNLRILPLHKRPHNDLAREVCERVLYI